jgi:hypothetical protein
MDFSISGRAPLHEPEPVKKESKVNREQLFTEVSRDLNDLASTLDQLIRKSKDPKFDSKISPTFESKDVAVFLGVLAEDIKTLAKSGSDPRLEEIRQKWQSISDELYSSFIVPLTDVERPLMGKPIALSEAGKAHAEGDVRKGLENEELNRKYMLVPIKGDGDCLFRAIVGDLAKNIQDIDPELRVKFIEQMRASCETHFPEHSILVEFDTFAENLLKHPDQPTDKQVAFLRKLVCLYHQHYGSDAFKAEACLIKGDVDTYIQDMGPKGKKMYGGADEIHAVSELFRLGITVVDIAGSGQKESLEQHLFAPEHAISHIAVAYRPGHYDRLEKRV